MSAGRLLVAVPWMEHDGDGGRAVHSNGHSRKNPVTCLRPTQASCDVLNNAGWVSRTSKLFERIVAGVWLQSVRFDDLCKLLSALGFQERTRGSHRIFTRDGIAEIVNVQPRRDGTAKPYQLRQIRRLILEHHLEPGSPEAR